MNKTKTGKTPVEQKSTDELLARLSLAKSVIKLLQEDQTMANDPRQPNALAIYRAQFKTLADELRKRDAMPKTGIGLQSASLISEVPKY